MFALLSLLVVAAPPEVALLCTSPTGTWTELRFQRVGAREVAPAVARFTHAEGSTVLGVLLPKSRVVLATATMPAKDLTWASALVRLEAGHEPRVLADRLGVSTRPVVTAEGRVFVQRGRAGEERPEGREDELTIDEVHPTTGEARTVYEARGGLAFLAGALGHELVVYRVDSSGGRLEAVHVDSLGVRLLARVGDLARDFVVDPARRRIVFTQGDAASGRWAIRELTLGEPAAKTLAEGDSMALLPALWPDGRVVWVRGEGTGVHDVGGARVLEPQGRGFDRVRAVVGGVAIGLDEVPSDFPSPFAVSVRDGQRLPLVAPDRVRLDVAGVAP